jgi:hypothetical protein
MPIKSDKNLYPGVNAHLNSHLQKPNGGWGDFHGRHITHIAEALDAGLPSGYYTREETGLQIREQVEPPSPRSSRTVPDVTVYQSAPSSGVAVLEATVNSPAASIPLADTLTDEDYLMSVVIYDEAERPITRIEVLSPANKPPGAHHEQYAEKRSQTLHSGLNMVEVDYLHQTRPVILGVRSYADGEKGAFPYMIVVSDPHPTFDEGLAHIYGFGVDAELPKVRIPLKGKDAVALDFGAVYTQTFESSRYFRMVVDYEQEPTLFEKYAQADRERIEVRLASIRKAQPSSEQ